VADRLQRELETGLDLLNDANLAALGEYSAGSGRGRGLFVYLHIGTGLGAGIVANGKLFPGAHGAAGEIGYLPWGTRGDDGLTSSSRGLLEDAAAADAVVTMARQAGMKAASAKEVFDAARDGDATAIEVVKREAQRLAHAVAAIAAVIDPELVVLGGGLGHSADLLLEPLKAELAEITLLEHEVAASELGGTAVLRGAISSGVAIARERVFEAWQAAQVGD
jgi:predicted NBD/HSP70 family sugar kinase